MRKIKTMKRRRDKWRKRGEGGRRRG